MSYSKLKKNGASAIIINNKRVLLFHRDNIPTISYPDHWGLPGGGINEGEKPLETVKRELQEEVGYAPKELHFIGKKMFGPNHTGYFFVSFVDDHERKQFKHTGDEGQEIGFFSLDEMLRLKMTPVILNYVKAYESIVKKMIDERYIPSPSDLDLLPED